MLSLLRLLFSFISLMVGWGVILAIIETITWNAVKFFAPVLYPTWQQMLELQVSELVKLNVLGALGLLILHFLVFIIIPPTWLLAGFVTGKPRKPAKTDTKILPIVEEMSQRMGVRKPKVLLCQWTGSGALSLANIWRPIIIMSPDLSERLTTAELKFVVCHELAHIEAMNAQSSGFVMSSHQTLRFAWTAYQKIVEWLSRFFSLFHLPGLLPTIMAILIVSPFLLFGETLRIVDWISGKIFQLFDFWISRNMIFRADHRACEVTGSQSALTALEKLGATSGNNFGHLSESPTSTKRIQKIRSCSDLD